MKKVLFIAAVALFGLGKASAQETTYGLTAGFHSLTASVSGSGINVSDSASGFFAGFFIDFNVSEKFNIQPEIQFASTYKDGENGSMIIIPIMAKYYVSDKFNVQAGPQFDLVLDDSERLNKLGFGLGFGVGYDFSEKLFSAARYSIGLNNRIEDAPSDMSAKLDTFQIGLGYRF